MIGARLELCAVQAGRGPARAVDRPVAKLSCAGMNEPHTRHLDDRALRALAHPLRLRILSLLRHDGPATATLLAARLDEAPLA